MSTKQPRVGRPSVEVQRLRKRLEEAEETLRAIKSGEVDAVVVSDAAGTHVFTLEGADRPYRLLVESMQEGALTIASDGLILYSNHRFAQMLGHPLEQVLGATIRSFISAADLPAFEALLANRSNRNCHGELDLITRVGDQLTCNFTLSPLPKEMGSAVCVIVTDLTEQKRIAALERLNAEARERERIYEAEKKAHGEVRRIAKRLTHLQAMTSLLSGALTIEQISDIVRGKAAAIVDASAGAIALLNEGGTMLKHVGAPGHQTGLMDGLMPMDGLALSIDQAAPSAEAARLLTPIWIESPEVRDRRYPQLAALTAQSDHQAWSVIPLLAENRLIGTVGFAFPLPHTFNAEERAFILTVAQQIAQAMDRALLYQAERTARHEAETADLLKLEFLGMIPTNYERRWPQLKGSRRLCSTRMLYGTPQVSSSTWRLSMKKRIG